MSRADRIRKELRQAARAGKPQPTLQTLGDLLGLTRQRVSQIIHDEGIEWSSTGYREAGKARRTCPECGGVKKTPTAKRCQKCQRKTRSEQGASKMVCPECGGVKKTPTAKRCRECWHKWKADAEGNKTLTLKCANCGNTFERLVKEQRNFTTRRSQDGADLCGRTCAAEYARDSRRRCSLTKRMP